jgi:hypothetical protein
MAILYEFDFKKIRKLFNNVTFTIHVVVTDDPIGNRSEFFGERRRLYYLRINLSDMETETLETETDCFCTPCFRHKKLFAKIRRAIEYMEMKTAVWEVQDC